MDWRTIRDVAREAGVSVSTVSRVLNEKPDVAPATRERVQAVIASLNFRANPAARRLAGASIRAVGLLMPGLRSQYELDIMRGVAEAVAATGRELVVYYQSDATARKLRALFARLMRSPIDGLVIVLPRSAEDEALQLQQRGMPVVLVDHRGLGTRVPAVAAANFQGGCDGTRYLLGLGHRRIGYIVGDPAVPASGERLAGYQHALAEAGLPVDEGLIYRGDFSSMSGYAAARALMALPDPPTAIFAANDLSALGVLDSLRDLGLRIPQDVSVVGFDDVRNAADAHPPLTTVRQPLAEMGATAVGMLLDILNGQTLPSDRVELPTHLIVRESCAPVGVPIGGESRPERVQPSLTSMSDPV
jgi:LacI family transcriptional regulator